MNEKEKLKVNRGDTAKVIHQGKLQNAKVEAVSASGRVKLMIVETGEDVERYAEDIQKIKKAKKKVVDIKLYSDSLEIYWEDGKGGLGGDRFENLNHVVGKYSRAEWLRDSIIMEYDRESQQEILDSLRRFSIRPNKPFFAQKKGLVIKNERKRKTKK